MLHPRPLHVNTLEKVESALMAPPNGRLALAKTGRIGVRSNGARRTDSNANSDVKGTEEEDRAADGTWAFCSPTLRSVGRLDFLVGSKWKNVDRRV